MYYTLKKMILFANGMIFSACIHDKITSEVYQNPRKPECDIHGHYEQIQCDHGVCFCVDTVNGNEVPATRAKAYTEPVCTGKILRHFYFLLLFYCFSAVRWKQIIVKYCRKTLGM